MKRSAVLVLALTLLTPLATGISVPAQAEPRLEWLAEHAYTYTLPLVVMYRTRWRALYDPDNPGQTPTNRFRHRRRLADPSDRRVTAPITDTLVSSAWLDLAPEPLILNVPATGRRYYTLQFVDFYTNSFAYIGRRTGQTRGGAYLIAGPRWNGPAPADLPRIVAPTNAVWVIGRFLVDGEQDVPAVHALQDALSLTPLSAWSGSARPSPAPAAAGRQAPNPEDPLDHFALANLALTENPPPVSETAWVDRFRAIGVGPGLRFDAGSLGEGRRATLRRAMARVDERMRAISARPPRVGPTGWSVPHPSLGNYGTRYSLRAIVAVVGLGANVPDEAMYLGAVMDANWRPLTGQHRYVLHFRPGALPPVDAFWSLTMYSREPDLRSFLVANPIGRYSIGNRTAGLRFDPDGSLDIYIQHAPPDPEGQSNWLPAPAGDFRLILRAYEPQALLRTGAYRPPSIVRRDGPRE